MSTIVLPEVGEPLVSVVVVTYGGWDVAKRTLEALVRETEPCYEVVIVDNASPDGTADRLREEVEGATLLFNDENLGFGAACNQGAKAASGALLCLLNSDALVQPGWLPPLLELIGDGTVGAVTPLLLNENGSVQEAGSIIDSAGWALAVGDGDDPSRFEYRFPREIDFGSAACLLLRRETFLEVGGFDDAYAPAYFEDVDLCFKLKDRGLRTMYEPRSRVVHLRFGSGSSDAARELMVRNREAFYARWAERLLERPRVFEVAAKPRRLVAARDAEALDRVLVIDDRVPYHDRGSGDPRMAKLLAELAALWPSARITLAAPEGREANRYAEPLLRQGIEVVAPPVDWERWFESRLYHYSVVIVSRHQNFERFDPFLRRTQPQALRVFDTEALTFRRLDLQLETTPAGKARDQLQAEAARARASELMALDHADAVFAVTDEEAELISVLSPGKPVFVLPHFVDAIEEPAGFEERRDLLFFGGFLAGPGSPNEDALLYLVHNVLPAVWKLEPDLVLHVVGADPTPAVLALHGERVNVVGYVEDPNEWLSRTRLHVSPMRFGAGVRLRLLDTIAAGLPFVTSRVGAEGLPLGELRPLLVAEQPAELARLVHELYRDAELWQRVQRNLLRIAHERFDRAGFQRTLIEAMSHLGVAPPPRPLERAVSL